MQFLFGQTVRRERRKLVADPYNPAVFVPGSWFDPLDVLTVESAFVGSSSSVAPADATRSQILTEKSLYLTDAGADVLPGDRVVILGAPPFYVNVRPVADVSPFTGWQPVLEIPLELVEG